jgi:hypothetical protein
MKEYYKIRLCEDEVGLILYTDTYVEIKQTEFFSFCVDEYHYRIYLSASGIDKIKAAKSKNIKIHRIHKDSSRFAFASKQKAYENLLYRKNKQIKHLEREIAILKKFLEVVDSNGVEDFERDGKYQVLPNTCEIVNQYYRFN